MTAGEITIAVLTAIGIVLGILKVWIQSQTDVARLLVQIAAINQRCDKGDQELIEHKREDAIRYEQMRTENREDHGKLFDRFDKFTLTASKNTTK